MRPAPYRTPPYRTPLADPVDPREAFVARYAGAPNAFWLDAGPAGRHLLGVGEPVALRPGAVLPGLRAALPGSLGLVGWLEYELRGETLGADLPLDRAPAAFLRVREALAVDAATGRAELWSVDPAPASEERPWRPSEAGPPGPAVARDGDERYLGMIAECREAIRAGEAYQLCLTSSTGVDGIADPVAAYLRLRETSPSHHGGFLRIGGTSLLSSSPERFLEVADGRVATHPIKGTRPRGATPEEDARLRDELLASEKERAENLMIVDLMRNDLQRVCEVGSVEVSRLLEVESYPHVHQLVSTVEGRMRDGLDAIDAIAACFPAGSMTGAPKRRAIEILDGLEAQPRGVYSGAFGWLAPDGSAELAMVIRSAVVADGRATVGSGGGITALSVPTEEVAEMRLKAAPLLAALRGE